MPDGPLSARGMRQAQLLAERLGGVPFTGAWHSPLQRAVETARIIAEEITLGEFVDLDEALRRLALVTRDDVQALAADLAAAPLSISAVGALTPDVFAPLLGAGVGS